MLRWNCPKCQELLEAPESGVGSSFTCPNCGNVSAAQIPAAAQAQSALHEYRNHQRELKRKRAVSVLIWSVILLFLCGLAQVGNAALETSGEPSTALTLISGICGIGFVVFLISGIVRIAVAS